MSTGLVVRASINATTRSSIASKLPTLRYLATDGKSPSHLSLTTYDHDDPSSIAESDSQSESTRKVYKQVGVYNHPSTTPASLPGKYIITVAVELPRAGEDEFNKWYIEEHVGLLMKVPGWLRCRRYIEEDSETGGEVCKYLAIQELDNDNYPNEQAFKDAQGTPWRAQVMKTFTRVEVRPYALSEEI